MNEKEIKALIKKEVKKQTELGCRGDLNTLKILTKRGRNFCLEILWSFRDELDKSNSTDGFVIYPSEGVKSYNYDVDKMINWLKENEERVFG